MARYSVFLVLIANLIASAASETVLGAYIFHRHGDRTPKILPPTNLTDLGYREVFNAGGYFRSRYLLPRSSKYINGISTNIYNQNELFVSSPADTVLQNSATGFLQGLYPPIGAPKDTSTLRGGSKVTAPMNGYQLIPVSIVETGTSSENSGWLQDSTSCLNAETSSNEYYYSAPYTALYHSTMSFYHKLEPVIGSVFNRSSANFKNAYTIFDYVNVAEIHNQTIPHAGLLTPSTLLQLRTLADTHEYHLAFNASSKIRSIAGMQLAAEIVDFFNQTISTGAAGQNGYKLGVQFGAYATFQSFFGLARLPQASPNFYGLPGYASAMVFELFTPGSTAGFPASSSDLMVRFLFHNGTTNSSSPPTPYPLFGQGKMALSWAEFTQRMGMFSVGSTAEWCHACGNTTGICSPYAPSSSSAAAGPSGHGSGISNAVAGVIGAMVALAVILLVEIVVMFAAGLRLVRKKRLLQARSTAAGGNGTKARDVYAS